MTELEFAEARRKIDDERKRRSNAERNARRMGVELSRLNGVIRELRAELDTYKASSA